MRCFKRSSDKIIGTIWLVIVGALILLAVAGEIVFQWKKYRVLHADADDLRQFGRHFIIGYTHPDELLPLIQKGAIGGIYITQRNVKQATIAQIRQEIAYFQEVQASAGLPPLFIATDQEGGIVSHLSPPLRRLPALSSLAAQYASSPTELLAKVREYGQIHGEDLRTVGVNLNLSPVVDVKREPRQFFFDQHSRIQQRAIAEDVAMIAQVALTYSRSLEQSGVIPTLKHFPGLGRATADTHYMNAELRADLQELQETDWFPFQAVLRQSHAFMMLSHATLRNVDPKTPVSYSVRVIQGIIREQWQHEGVLITDDFSMYPIAQSHGGIGQAAVSALNAGVDLILISYDGEKYYEAMYALLQAEKHHCVDHLRLSKSQQRLNNVWREGVLVTTRITYRKEYSGF